MPGFLDFLANTGKGVGNYAQTGASLLAQLPLAYLQNYVEKFQGPGLVNQLRRQEAIMGRSNMFQSAPWNAAILNDPKTARMSEIEMVPRSASEPYSAMENARFQELGIIPGTLSADYRPKNTLPALVPSEERTQNALRLAQAQRDRAEAEYLMNLGGGGGGAAAPAGMVHKGRSIGMSRRGPTVTDQYEADTQPDPMNLGTPDAAGRPAGTTGAGTEKPVGSAAIGAAAKEARRRRAGMRITGKDEVTGEDVGVTFGPDGMSAKGDDGTDYIVDEKAGALVPVPPMQPAPAAPAPAAPAAPAAEPGTVEAAPPPTLPAITPTTTPTTSTTSTTAPPAAAPALDQDEALLFGPPPAPPVTPDTAPDDGSIGFPSPAWPPPGVSPTPPSATPRPLAPATPVQPVGAPARGRVALPGGSAAPPVAKAGPSTPAVATGLTRADLLAAAGNDPVLSAYMQEMGLTDPERALNDKFVVTRVRKFLSNEKVSEASDIATAQQRGKIGAGEKGQIKRIQTIRKQLELVLAPMEGENPDQIAPIDIGPETGSFGSQWAKSQKDWFEDVPVIRGIARSLTPAGSGIPSVPPSMQTWSQIAGSQKGVVGRAAARMDSLVAGSAPQLVKAFGDTGQLSQQEQETARERLFPSFNDTYQVRYEKVITLMRVLDNMEEALAKGTPMDSVHDMATDAIGAERSLPTRRVTRSAGSERRRIGRAASPDVYEEAYGE